VSGLTQRASEWVYTGVWAVLTDLFRVPREPPALPAGSHESVVTFRPSEGWLNYRKVVFWIVLAIIDILLIGAWIAILVTNMTVGLILALPWLALVILPDIFAYVAIYLRYDTTWYVLTDRSMRLRRGIWIIHEITITYENIQNLSVTQGPLQRYFGFSDLTVQTAGGGAAAHPKGGGGGGHSGVLEGLADAASVREIVMQRVRASRSAGLGDEAQGVESERSGPEKGWSAAHIAALTRIRDEARAAAAALGAA